MTASSWRSRLAKEDYVVYLYLHSSSTPHPSTRMNNVRKMSVSKGAPPLGEDGEKEKGDDDQWTVKSEAPAVTFLLYSPMI